MAITKADQKLLQNRTPIKLRALCELPIDTKFIIKKVSNASWVMYTEFGDILICKRDNVRRFKTLNAIEKVLTLAGADTAKIEL